jgi:gliding motility-associated-like protein
VANAGSDQTLYPEDQAILGGNPTTNDDHLITWSPTEWLVDDDVPNPMTHPLVQSATFYLEVIDLNGCAAQDSVTINIIPDLDIPSGFTPNDDGMNDVWVLENAELYPSLVVEIYNRWGELLYRADRGYLRPWDGTYNGSPVPIGTYYYIIEIKEPNFEATVNGPLTILR